MVLESTVICVDNSDYMRNGDFIPSRLQAQQDAVNLICNAKTRSNPENNVALVTMANTSEVLTTLTTDVGKVMAKLQQVQPKGEINLVTGVRIAHLALRHRQGRNHRMRIVVFVGSPLQHVKPKDLSQLAKKLKKEKVSVDIVNFGLEQDENDEILQAFVEELRGKEGGGSHLATLPGGCDLVDTLARSPIVKGEDGAGAVAAAAATAGSAGGFEFGVDPMEDPELAMALRVSMEEQRQRQERDARAAAQSQGSSENRQASTTDEENMLVQALTGSSGAADTQSAGTAGFPDFGSMSEEDQIAYAIQMSMQEAQGGSGGAREEEGKKKKDEKKEGETDTEDPEGKRKGAGAEEAMEVDQPMEDADFSSVVQDAEFLQSVLQTLPGVDPQSDAVRSAVGSVAREEKKKDEKKEDGKE